MAKKKILQFIKRWELKIKGSKLYKKYGKVFLISSLILIIIILGLQVSLSSLSQVRLDFLKLRDAYNSNYPCHEDCLMWRGQLRAVVVSNFASDENLYSDWLRYWQESIEEKNYDLQKELISIALELDDQEEVSLVLAESVLDLSLDSQSRANIINIYFSKLDDTSLANYYFNLLAEGDSNLKRSALIAISNFSDKEAVINPERLAIIEGLIMSPDIEKDLLADLLFLLFELELYQTEETRATLFSIYENSGDVVIRHLVAQHLDALGLVGYLEPQLSEAELENYFTS